MIQASLVILLSFAGVQQSSTENGVQIANRLVAAIKGASDFRDADFVKPLVDADKVALRQFASCKVKHVRHALVAVSVQPHVLQERPNEVSIGLNCKTSPPNQPVGISLHLQDGKIAKIETHNADLMRVN